MLLFYSFTDLSFTVHVHDHQHYLCATAPCTLAQWTTFFNAQCEHGKRNYLAKITKKTD